MEADTDENDGFDWEAAAVAMENISLLDDRPRNQGNGNVLKENQNRSGKGAKLGAGAPLLANAKLHQKTLLSFVQRSNQQPRSIEKSNQQPINNAVPCADDIANTDGSRIDLEAAKTWVYPVNVSMRDYQYSIVQTALFSNTLVSLPTGLGKTLIAAVVMYNFFRWFPTGKIVFTAPSRPLVLQQIEACHESVGIPQEWTIDMTGQMNPGQRSAVWQAKRVFFVTPQVFEKDIQSGTCPMQDLVCLVVDEAHRAMGNYSYCVVVRKLMEASIKLRILALTATPGSKQVTIQSVVDNLQISCLEYRNENDTDVKQYVHNRKLELLQVGMDLESLKIRDLFLEVLQPLVNRLCSFGVFYSRDAARLTPFEFLTARDKFRQAPPPGIDPRQFGEVEACFGATITLYHTFKLLFSHGIRPAFEMLKEKLQSGPFGRLMGRNEKLQEITLLMQKHVRNGASSPKLSKLLELMADHFQANDPSKTRVIIFTNFRESVKDILEALKVLGDIVKAMDFIGQSSGKSSKGQSQKVQQLVLQKFRMGGFNTIVATSIAEEGLDIMEVDLVICFDANISPLRMIQRMGRTGRKRDGRVVILASEGAEAQGYLKKQAKSQVLGKHMHNGGVHSFNFHSSPRMVPHSIRPEAQSVELSIVQFVPRMKSKQKAVQILDIGVTDLTAEEALMLRRYIKPHQPATVTWKPSLIAFPQCQLLPTQVHHVRHSERTISMLIDTLQSLHEYKARGKNDTQACAFSGDILREEGGTVFQADAFREEDCGREDPDRINGYPGEIKHHNREGLGSALGTPLSSCPVSNTDNVVAREFDSHLPFVDLVTSAVSPSLSPHFGKAVPMALHPTFPAQVTKGADACWPLATEEECAEFISHHATLKPIASAVETPSLYQDLPDNTDNSLLQPTPLDAHTNSNCLSPGVPYSPTCVEKLKSSQSPLESCLYNRIVSVDARGHVRIASPPMLPLGDSFLQYLNSENNMVCNSFFSTMKQMSKMDVRRRFGVFEEHQDVEPVLANRLETKTYSVASSPGPRVGYFVASTPEEKIPNRISEDKEYTHGCQNSISDDSPRLCTLAEQGLVPSSPGLEKNSLQPAYQFCHENMGTLYRESISNSANCSLLKGEKLQALCGSPRQPSVTSEEIRKITDSRCKLDNLTVDDTNITRALSAIKVSNGHKVVPMKLFTEELIGKLSADIQIQTPVLQQSTSNNWNQPLDASCSVQKPKRFRRLCKAKETSKQPPPKLHPSQRPSRRPGKKKVHCEAALLVDEEAEVSSDEDVSADEDDGEDDQGSLQDFIDDKVEPTVDNSEGSDEPIDMMAVYRKSLLTQSPLDGHSLPWMQRLLQTGTPVSDNSNFPSSKCSESMISVSSDSRSKLEPNSCRDFRNRIWELQATPALASLALEDNREHLNILNPHATKCDGFVSNQKEIGLCQLPGSMQSTTKVHERKRKLSFQQEEAASNVPNLSKHFDDDLFDGLDLDALEVEAVQKSRSHLQGATTTQQGVAPGVLQMQSNNKDVDLHDENFDFFPSFNLGIDY